MTQDKYDWVDLPEFPGYMVCREGKVLGLRGQILKPAVAATGYLVVNLTKDGKQGVRAVHRLIASAFVSNPEGKPHINHKNAVRTDPCADNLEWVTIPENNAHTRSLGRQARGESHGWHKLTEGQVREIRATKGLLSNRLAGIRYGVAPSCISRIRTGHSWGWLA